MKVIIRSVYEDFVPSEYFETRIPDTKIPPEFADEILRHDHGSPCFVSAGTGAGKTTLAAKLICRMDEMGLHSLYLANRKAVTSQQKREIAKIRGDSSVEHYTEIGLEQQEDFGNLRIVTYQRAVSMLSNTENCKWLSKVRLVILDEAHYFVEDALFNPYCQMTLENVIGSCSDANRVYLSATPWSVLNVLGEAERDQYSHMSNFRIPLREPRAFYYYEFARDYSGIDLNFIPTLDAICPVIQAHPNEKFLIFTASKEEGKRLAEKIGEQAEYLDSSMKTSETWKRLISESRFDRQVLVTTSVAYNGVNIIDADLRHIVIDAMTRTQLIQMLGRKRLKKGETVKAWVVDMPREKITRRYGQIAGDLKWCSRYTSPGTDASSKLAAELWKEENPALRKLFYIGNNGKLYKNDYAEFELRRRAYFLESLLRSKREHPFQDAVRSWLSLEPETERDYAKELMEFYLRHKGLVLNETDQDELRKMVLEIAAAKGIQTRSDRRDSAGVQVLNSLLEKLGTAFTILPSWRFRCLQEDTQ